jgi:lipoprotein-anchoring transpeptidase ErfK/SrfK
VGNVIRCSAAAVLAAAVWLLALSLADRANAEVVIAINKSTQRLHVMVDGAERYVWKTSTGTGGGPKNGAYRPERMERSWYSPKFGMSPMPYSIFFHEGYAIHGTIYLSRLGSRASHGCVRLHPDNAKILFDLVREQGMGNTRIVVSNDDDVASKSAAPAAHLR